MKARKYNPFWRNAMVAEYGYDQPYDQPFDDRAFDAGYTATYAPGFDPAAYNTALAPAHVLTSDEVNALNNLANVAPLNANEIAAKLAIAKQVIPGLENIESLTAAQIDAILNNAKAEAIQTILRAQPSTSMDDINSVVSIVDLVQIADIMKSNNKVSFKSARYAVEQNTITAVEDLINSGVATGLISMPPSYFDTVNNDKPVDNTTTNTTTNPATTQKTAVALNLGLTPTTQNSTLVEGVNDKTLLYIVAAVAALGIIVYITKR